MATAARELIESRLTGTSLAGFVATRRRAGAGWRHIADEVTLITGYPISHSTLRNWFPNAPQRKELRPAPHRFQSKNPPTETVAS
ncbi:hypothetical protein CH289_16135 [Rhodococcus sp. RS1C4]|uniref:hypothetical protein n=1 Tax=Rhodococcoides fascians TaxID=1828 RepID=UPI00055DCC96|nr:MULTISPECIES: hypothetical protein [Rhodococcus]OZC50554.1 hypothetical protein CH289_16135 [Rhodococcus sp. RS1C4]OZD65118.1 hypothetical protein CH263_13320 [Rhodococcus sp. 06-1059B-a]